MVKNNVNKIVETCREMGVKSLSLFGFAVRVHDFEERSDVDFLDEMLHDNNGKYITQYDFFDLIYGGGLRNKCILKSIKTMR